MKSIRRRVSDSDEDDTPIKSVFKTLSKHAEELRYLRNQIPLPCEYDISKLKSLAEVFDIKVPDELTETNSREFGILVGKVEKVVFAKQMELAGIEQRKAAMKSPDKKPTKKIGEVSEIPPELR